MTCSSHVVQFYSKLFLVGMVQNHSNSGLRLWYWISPEVMAKEFKKYCIYDEMDGKEGEEGGGNVGCEN